MEFMGKNLKMLIILSISKRGEQQPKDEMEDI